MSGAAAGKAPDAFRTISEAAAEIGVEAHVLRFWETKFAQVRPVKRAGNRRYYRARDIALLSGIRRMLREEGMTIKGVQRMLREKGVGHVAARAAEAPAETDAPAPTMATPVAPPVVGLPIEAAVRTAIPDDMRLVLRPARPRVDPERPPADRAALAAAFGRLEAIRARL